MSDTRYDDWDEVNDVNINKIDAYNLCNSINNKGWFEKFFDKQQLKSENERRARQGLPPLSPEEQEQRIIKQCRPGSTSVQSMGSKRSSYDRRQGGRRRTRRRSVKRRSVKRHHKRRQTHRRRR